MSGHFKVKTITNLDDVKLGDVIPESDYAHISRSGNFIQLEYVEESGFKDKYKVKPGIFAIQKTNTGLILEPFNFIQDEILESFISTQDITTRVDCFFRNIHVYKEHGFEIPKRAAFLYGPGGTGKSTAVTTAIKKYLNDGQTLVVNFPTDKIDITVVKDFIASFDYGDSVKRMIFIMEDIGGVEVEQTRVASQSSLLSLLDNNHKTYTIPTFIIATTNFPEMFLANIANRPGRFDDKIEVGYPKPEQRYELLKFFNKKELDEDATKLIKGNKCSEFSPAHIKEVIIRAAIHEKSLKDVISEISQEIELYKKNFVKNKSIGMGLYD